MPAEPSLESVAIVGTGAVGTALAHAFVAAGVPVVVAGRSRERAQSLAARIPGASAIPLAEAGSAAPTVLLAVSDSAIAAACAAIDAKAGSLVAHTSGSRDVTDLDAARARGALVGGFHPLAAVIGWDAGAAVASDAYSGVFRGAAFAIEGTPPVQSRLAPLARALGGVPFAIAAADKPLYHLGASILAAFSAGLAHVAWDQLRAAGAPDTLASAGVAHLLHTVADNIERAASPAAALTGPVARGDAAGVLRQRDAARALSPEAQELYRVHVMHNIQLALGAGRIDPATAVTMIEALGERASGRAGEWASGRAGKAN